MEISSASTGTPARSARDILVVDDSRANLEAIGRSLVQAGYRPCLCASGSEALDRVQGRHFDLMLLDMDMPQMMGVSVLHELRAMHSTQSIPVMMMSPRTDPGAVIEALNAGADDHIAWPIDFEVLAARMDRLIDRARNLAELRESNIALDARIAHRAIEIGELRERVAAMQSERLAMTASLSALQDQLNRFSA